MPFLHDDFDAGQVMAAVCAMRSRRIAHATPDYEPPAEWGRLLLPEAALRAQPDRRPLDGEPMSSGGLAVVGHAVAGLGVLFPAWAPLLALPVEYWHLPASSGAVSASAPFWPQRIFLSRQIMADPAEVHEQVLHEWCHQWLYLIEEVWPLQTDTTTAMDLPSGTPRRAPREVIGAAHVAAVLLRLYRRTGEPDQLPTLLDYGRGCLDLLEDAAADLTTEGAAMTLMLTKELR
ncbi:hypothetical protein Lfu02_49630 [Longispora fulva]|nr:hypothetical protein Lfu02_49630 [Longispora fulva]